MKKINLPIFWKFNIGIISIVLCFASINGYLIKSNIQTALESEIQKRAEFIGRNIANQAINPLLFEDLVALQRAVDEAIAIDSAIAYVFILDPSNKVLIHTFKSGFPVNLIEANAPENDTTYSSKQIQPVKRPKEVIRDLAIPIMENKLGVVRIGLKEENIARDVNHAVRSFGLMAILFLSAGILGSLLFARFITNPIKTIQRATAQLDLKALEGSTLENIHIRESFLGFGQALFRAYDEIDILAEHFNRMLTRLRKAYSDLQLAQAKLLQSEKMASVGIIAAGMAHEINNPIAGLKSCLRRLGRDPKNIDQNLRYLEMMEEAAGRIENVMRNLLDFSRRQDIAFSAVAVSEVIQKSLLLVAYKLEKSHITVTKEINKNIPPVNGSANHLQQVFVNLLINAVDAIDERCNKDPKAPRRITFNVGQENNSVLISVTDSGIGLEKNEMAQIFNAFYTTKQIGKGTGLGLAVCYNIIEAHQGSIEVTSKMDEGTSFNIRLPIYQSSGKRT